MIVVTLAITMKPIEAWQRPQETGGLPIAGSELAHVQGNEDAPRQTEERKDEVVFPQAGGQWVLDCPKQAEPLAQIDQPSGKPDIPSGAPSISRRERTVSCCASRRAWRTEVHPPDSARLNPILQDTNRLPRVQVVVGGPLVIHRR